MIPPEKPRQTYIYMTFSKRVKVGLWSEISTVGHIQKKTLSETKHCIYVARLWVRFSHWKSLHWYVQKNTQTAKYCWARSGPHLVHLHSTSTRCGPDPERHYVAVWVGAFRVFHSTSEHNNICTMNRCSRNCFILMYLSVGLSLNSLTIPRERLEDTDFKVLKWSKWLFYCN